MINYMLLCYVNRRGSFISILGQAPSEIVAILPRSGEYQISVGNVLVPEKRFVGDYRITLESSACAKNTLPPAYLVK
jgi:hypothetical protein